MKEKAKRLYEGLRPHRKPILLLAALLTVLLSAVQTALALRACRTDGKR